MTAPLPASRRQIIKAAALTAVGLLGERFAGPALARAPMTNTQAPAFYRFKLGAFECTVVSDGPLNSWRAAAQPLRRRFQGDVHEDPCGQLFADRERRT